MHLVKLYVQPKSSCIHMRDMRIQGEYEIGVSALNDTSLLMLAAMHLFDKAVPIYKPEDFTMSFFYQGVQLVMPDISHQCLTDRVDGYVHLVSHKLPEYMKAPETLYEYAKEVDTVLANMMPYVLKIDAWHHSTPVFDQAHRLLLKTRHLIKKIKGVSKDDMPHPFNQHTEGGLHTTTVPK